MLVIRPEQMNVFEQAARSRFEAKMMTYIREHLPEKYTSLGADRIRKEIRLGIDQAKSHSASSELAIAQYIELMFTFGLRFNPNPPHDTLEWISGLLSEDSQDTDRTIEYIYATASEKGEVTGLLLQASSNDLVNEKAKG